MIENRLHIGESSGSFETLEINLDAPDAFERLRAFFDPSYTTDDEIRAAMAERQDIRTITVTRWFTLPRAAFRRVAQIGEPSDAPSVAQLMEDLNAALGHPPLGAEPNTPKSVWERLIDEVYRLANPQRRA